MLIHGHMTSVILWHHFVITSLQPLFKYSALAVRVPRWMLFSFTLDDSPLSSVGRALAFHHCVHCLIPSADMLDGFGH